MRAVMFDRYGDESVLGVREIAVPDPGANEVQVRVHVASLNPVDFKLRAGLFRLVRKPKLPAITGKDFAGRVSAIGANVTGFSLGQRVFGSVNPMPGSGSCAQILVIGTDLLAATPDAVTDEVAACLPVASGTALQALKTIAHLRTGQSILITGASGAVGSSAVQFARSVGAHITGVCGTANVGYVRSIGADEVVDYKKADWRRLGLRRDLRRRRCVDLCVGTPVPVADRLLHKHGSETQHVPDEPDRWSDLKTAQRALHAQDRRGVASGTRSTGGAEGPAAAYRKNDPAGRCGICAAPDAGGQDSWKDMRENQRMMVGRP
jgi:Zn-dependent alcohol dehydrogenase/putative hemolysin